MRVLRTHEEPLADTISLQGEGEAYLEGGLTYVSLRT